MRNFPCETRMSFDGDWCQPIAVDSFLTLSVTRSLTLLSLLVVLPMAFDSLVRSDDEWSVAGKLNFLIDGDRDAFNSVVGAVNSSDDVKTTSGVKIERVGFVIIVHKPLIVCFCKRLIDESIKDETDLLWLASQLIFNTCGNHQASFKQLWLDNCCLSSAAWRWSRLDLSLFKEMLPNTN